MLYSIENIEESEKLNELVSLQNQVNEARLQDMLGKQNYLENTKKSLNHLLIQLRIPLKI